MEHKLHSKIFITGKVVAETGLMIGGSSSALEIGGTDKQIIRNPRDKMPYIPGSSLKGKMRSLLEQSRATIEGEGDPTNDPRHEAAQLFGHIKSRDKKIAEYQKESKQQQQPSRLIVRDGVLTNPDAFKDTELLYTEVKAENSINRITAAANPRFFERVPRSAEFELNIVLNVFDMHQEDAHMSLVYECLRLIEDDYLGGGGSRGNGQVKFHIKTVERRAGNFYKKGEGAIDLSSQIPDDLR